MTDKVRLASIGTGRWAGELADAVARSGQAEVVSGWARRPEGREAFGEKFGCRPAGSLEELLADPEVEGVIITTSHQSHREMIEQAAAAGKHVFVDKPFTNTVEDGLAAIAAARDAGVLLQVGHQRRRTPAKRRIKAMLEAGELGDVETVVTNQSIPNGFKMPETAWRWDPEQSPLGSMTSLGVHKIDTINYLVGPVRSVFAFTRSGPRQAHRRGHGPGPGVGERCPGHSDHLVLHPGGQRHHCVRHRRRGLEHQGRGEAEDPGPGRSRAGRGRVGADRRARRSDGRISLPLCVVRRRSRSMVRPVLPSSPSWRLRSNPRSRAGLSMSPRSWPGPERRSHGVRRDPVREA